MPVETTTPNWSFDLELAVLACCNTIPNEAMVRGNSSTLSTRLSPGRPLDLVLFRSESEFRPLLAAPFLVLGSGDPLVIGVPGGILADGIGAVWSAAYPQSEGFVLVGQGKQAALFAERARW
jgi:hypothetical protein